MSRDSTLGRIRLRHLQCFLAVAQLGNLRRAALALSVTQPAVTKTINELEDMLGTPLFVRGRKGATLTAEAEVFLRHATASVNALVQAVDSVAGGPAEATLRIGVLPTVAPSFMPQVLRAFMALRPLSALRVHTDRNTQLIDQLRSRELDVVIGRLADPDAMVGVTFEHLYAEPLAVALRPTHPLAARRAKNKPLLAELSSYPLVLPLPGTMIRQLADSFLVSHGIVPRAGLVETLDTSLARGLVRGGDHVWLTPLGAVTPDLESGAMARLDVTITPEEPVGLMLRTDSLPSAALQALLGVVRREAAAKRGPPNAPARQRSPINKK